MKITSFWLSLSLIIYGCSNSSETSIDCSSSGLSVEVINSQKSDCDVPGFLDVAGQGGELPYRYSLDGIEFQESERFEDLFAGSYTITIIDSKGCSSQTNFNLASEPTGITLTLSSSNANCLSANGMIMADASGGTGSLSYAIENGSFSNTNNFMNLSAGEYEVSVKDEENCIVTKKIRVKTNTSLSNDIMPIISSNCSISNCHNGTVPPNLTSSSAVIDNAQRIKSETQTGSMPRNGTLSNVDIALIACWVDDGAGDN